MSTSENATASSGASVDTSVFKKPLLIGKVGKFPKKVIKENIEHKVDLISKVKVEQKVEVPLSTENLQQQEVLANSDELEEKQIPFPYKEPAWSGIHEPSNKKYKFEVLKNGSIIETIDLTEKSFWVFGRLSNCDICMAHPTISRYHAVLQYRGIESEDQPKGFYLYDLSSTHGTFLNKNRLKPRTYVKVYVGHLLKLGLSSRSYLLVGPENDAEEESQFTVSELKQKRKDELLRREEAEKEATRKREEQQELMQKKLEERGVDWGLGEDADEEADLSENPFAQTNNEELYLDDPKKALRGFMEREGHDFEYDCTEQGMGQFLCKVELPLDDERGRPMVAEVLHKGKKKEAVVQCALEACRILDRYGLLRQATHESRKRKAKNWEENDFYDSDEDTFLDRTGTIEKKRENRMKAKIPEQPETYQGLLEKESMLRKQIDVIEKQLANDNKVSSATNMSKNEEDSLDNYMKELKQIKLDKHTISKLKSDLFKLKQDLVNVIKLANIAKPTSLPRLIAENSENFKCFPSGSSLKNKLPIFGKRLKVKVQMPARKENVNMELGNEEDIEEDDESTEITTHTVKTAPAVHSLSKMTRSDEKRPSSISDIKIKRNSSDFNQKYLIDCSRVDSSLKMIFPLMSNESEKYLRDIWFKMKSLHPKYSKILQEEIVNLFTNYINSCKFIAIIDTFRKEIESASDRLTFIKSSKDIIDVAYEIIKLAKEITLMANRLDQDIRNLEPNDSIVDDEELEKRRKKNQRRIQQRQEKAEIEKRKGYEEDAAKEDYNMWVPPMGQTGDGKTGLNEKYGY